MLKGIDPRLGADVLYALRSMGHGDMLILADANFPSHSMAAETVMGEPLEMGGLKAAEAAEAILSVMPLDQFAPDFAGRMQVEGKPDEIPQVQEEVLAAIALHGKMGTKIASYERLAFYGLARKSYAIVQTAERRFYGCFMLRKGVIPPEGHDAG